MCDLTKTLISERNAIAQRRGDCTLPYLILPVLYLTLSYPYSTLLYLTRTLPYLTRTLPYFILPYLTRTLPYLILPVLYLTLSHLILSYLILPKLRAMYVLLMLCTFYMSCVISTCMVYIEYTHVLYVRKTARIATAMNDISPFLNCHEYMNM